MQEQHKTFTTADGSQLFYRYRPAADGSSDKALVLFHRGHEHSGRMMFVADELGFDDFAYFAWDARGHGLSPGERGDSPSITSTLARLRSASSNSTQGWAASPSISCQCGFCSGAMG